MCRTYRQRPSEVVGIEDDRLALDFDLAMAAIHRAESRSKVDTAVAQSGQAEAGVITALIEQT